MSCQQTFVNGKNIAFDHLAGAIAPITNTLLLPISRDAVSVYLVDEFEWNLPQIFIMWVGIAERVFKVTCQGQGHDQTV